MANDLIRALLCSLDAAIGDEEIVSISEGMESFVPKVPR
jgi:hypothetical protein